MSRGSRGSKSQHTLQPKVQDSGRISHALRYVTHSSNVVHLALWTEARPDGFNSRACGTRRGDPAQDTDYAKPRHRSLACACGLHARAATAQQPVSSPQVGALQLHPSSRAAASPLARAYPRPARAPRLPSARKDSRTAAR